MKSGVNLSHLAGLATLTPGLRPSGAAAGTCLTTTVTWSGVKSVGVAGADVRKRLWGCGLEVIEMSAEGVNGSGPNLLASPVPAV